MRRNQYSSRVRASFLQQSSDLPPFSASATTRGASSRPGSMLMNPAPYASSSTSRMSSRLSGRLSMFWSEDQMVDMDISLYSNAGMDMSNSVNSGGRTREEEEDLGGFLHARIATFLHNMDAIGDMIAGSPEEEEEEEDPVDNFHKNRKGMRMSRTGMLLEDISESEADDYGNPQESSTHTASSFALLNRNMEGVARRISGASFAIEEGKEEAKEEDNSTWKGFFLARLDMFSKNVDFAQATAESLTRDLGNMNTFSKNVNFAQATAHTMVQEVGTVIERDVHSQRLLY